MASNIKLHNKSFLNINQIVGYVPLDELYKLNQVLQEASQRELYLETKLNALQQVVSEARKSADESWQAYVGEERLLSRVAVLERQLMQAGKGWSDEKLKEELDKLQVNIFIIDFR